jgi:hypothetical protein
LQSNCSCKRCLRIARIAQSVTPVTVIHSTARAQSQVATMHLIVYELPAPPVVSRCQPCTASETALAVAQVSDWPTASMGVVGTVYPRHGVSAAYDQRIEIRYSGMAYSRLSTCALPRAPAQRPSTHHTAVLLCTALAYMKPPMVAPFPHHWWRGASACPHPFMPYFSISPKSVEAGRTYCRYLIHVDPVFYLSCGHLNVKAYTPLPSA